MARTGAIGIIAVAGWEKFRGGTRVEFVCGGRALAGYHALRDIVAASVRLISVLPAELPAAIERMQGDASELSAGSRICSRGSRVSRAPRSPRAQSRIGPARVVFAALDGWDPNGLKTIASAIVERPGHVACSSRSRAVRNRRRARGGCRALDSAALLKQLTALRR